MSERIPRLRQRQHRNALDELPMPLPGLVASVRVLAVGDLAWLVGCALGYATIGVPSAAWQGCELALLAYGVAACRELECRGSLAQRMEAHGQRAQTLIDAARSISPNSAPMGASVRPENRVPSVRMRYLEPSWMRIAELSVRHRNALLLGQHAAWYESLGWKAQETIPGLPEPTTSLPPHDPLTPVVRCSLDTSVDWR